MAGKKPKTAVAVRSKSQEPVPLHPALSGGMTIGNLKIKVVKQVTLPHLKQEEGQPLALKFLCPIYTGKEIELKDKDGKPIKREDGNKPPQLARVINLEDNIEYTYIVGAVTESNLNLEYPDNGYVGKSFAIMLGPKPAGKRYRQAAVAEIEVD